MNLMLHCGSQLAELDEVLAVETPANTATHFPTPHGVLIDSVTTELNHAGYKIASEAHSLNHDGMSYFGLLQLESDHNDYTYVAGIRNDHEKRFAQGFACGMTVFVCDNLSFSGDIVVKRKHTRFALDQLQDIVQNGVAQLRLMQTFQDTRVDTYKHAPIDDITAHDLIIKAVDQKAIAVRKIPELLREWREPRHTEFEPRNVWSLFNCFTEVYKTGSLNTTHNKSVRLHRVMDNHLSLTA